MNNLRLTVPEPEIRLYEQGFEGVCKLGRAEDGRKLSDLVERIAEPMVIALDAPWGAGKSVFLKCWVGEHGLENEGAATTVYFDAFKHDYLDDPLVSIIGALDERVDAMPGDTPAKTRLQNGVEKVKTFAPAMAKGVMRGALNMATAGALREIEEAGASFLKEGVKGVSDELADATNTFWKAEETRRTAMEAFRKTLMDLATPEKKLVIVVDELDRCRPDYALTLLEVIKHFFDVPNVHFVLGVNLRELGNSVRARYGAGVNAEKYLQKFVTVVMPLADASDLEETSSEQIKHFRNVATQVGLRSKWAFQMLEECLENLHPSLSLSLRDVERLVTLASIAPEPEPLSDGAMTLYSSILIIKVAAPHLFEKIKTESASFKDFFVVFDIRSRSNWRGNATNFSQIWRWALGEDSAVVTNDMRSASNKVFGSEAPNIALRRIISGSIEAFDLPKV